MAISYNETILLSTHAFKESGDIKYSGTFYTGMSLSPYPTKSHQVGVNIGDIFKFFKCLLHRHISVVGTSYINTSYIDSLSTCWYMRQWFSVQRVSVWEVSVLELQFLLLPIKTFHYRRYHYINIACLQLELCLYYLNL